MNSQDEIMRRQINQTFDDMWLYVQAEENGGTQLHAAPDTPIDVLMNPFTAAGFVHLIGQYNESDHSQTLPEFLAAR